MSTKKFINGIFTTLPFVFILFVWLYFAVLHPIPFWYINDDYPAHALSHAFTLDSNLSGVKSYNYGYGVHPGIPFGFVSWLAFRLSTLGFSDSGSRISYALTHADSFWFWAKIFALALNITGLLVMKQIFKRPVMFFIASGVYFAGAGALAGFQSFLELENESFTLLYITLYYYLSYILLTCFSERRETIFKISTPDLLSCCLGALTAIGCSIKIYYMGPAVGLALGVMVAMIAGTFDKKTGLRIFILFLINFLLFGFFIVYFIISWPLFQSWVIWNWSMLFHAGRFGTGPNEFLKLSFVFKAINDLRVSTNGSFPIIFMFLIMTCLLTTLKRIKDKLWIQQYVPFVVTLLIGIFISLVALLKHYSPHYALPLYASLACSLLIIDQNIRNRVILSVGVIAVFILADRSVVAYDLVHQQALNNVSAVIRDVKIIEALPISIGQKRVWGYLTPAKACQLALISQYSGSPLVTQIYSHSTDISPVYDRSCETWRYVIFPKVYFPTQESISSANKMFDFSTTKFKKNNSDKILELETVFVLERA